jgi:FkbM family methyltransferase
MPLYASARRVPGSTEHSVSSSLFAESHRVGDAPFDTVRVIDFPAFLDTLPAAPALVKIDIEGAEVAILERLFETGRIGRMGRVFVETHEKQMPSLAARTLGLVDRAAAIHGRPVCLDWG